MYRSKKVCQKCGQPFFGASGRHYCQECAKKIRSKNVVITRICIDCGRTFKGGPRSKRCPECRDQAAKEICRQRRITGTKRPLGSLDMCEWCGAEYIVNSGRQKYCSDTCQRLAVLEWQREHKKGYSQIPKIRAEKKRKYEVQEKICPYCLRAFHSNSSSPYCSDYCRQEQRKLLQCIADINRGCNRDLDRYERSRDEYRKTKADATAKEK